MVCESPFHSYLPVLTSPLEGTRNLEVQLAILRRENEILLNDRDKNWELVLLYKRNLEMLTTLIRDFKKKTEDDALAWHANYRKQIDDERKRSLDLQLIINDKVAAAGRANAHLRAYQRAIAEDPLTEQLRQEVARYKEGYRFFKREYCDRVGLPYDDSIVDEEDIAVRKLAAEQQAESDDEEAAALRALGDLSLSFARAGPDGRTNGEGQKP